MGIFSDMARIENGLDNNYGHLFDDDETSEVEAVASDRELEWIEEQQEAEEVEESSAPRKEPTMTQTKNPSTVISVHLSVDLVKSIDNAAEVLSEKAHGLPVNRSQAIRTLIQIGLGEVGP